jgi:YgiT-type zinc finger domain-containing protein
VRKEEVAMATLEEKLAILKCPRCGREHSYVPREIDHVVRVGNNAVVVHVRVGVCDFCGEEAFDDEATNMIDAVVKKLREGATDDLTLIGATYRYP